MPKLEQLAWQKLEASHIVQSEFAKIRSEVADEGRDYGAAG